MGSSPASDSALTDVRLWPKGQGGKTASRMSKPAPASTTRQCSASSRRSERASAPRSVHCLGVLFGFTRANTIGRPRAQGSPDVAKVALSLGSRWPAAAPRMRDSRRRTPSADASRTQQDSRGEPRFRNPSRRAAFERLSEDLHPRTRLDPRFPRRE
jgi:hypothetical protein